MTTNHSASTIVSAVKDTAGNIADQVKGMVETGQDKLAAAKHKVVDAKDVVVDKAESMVSMLGNTIKAHPFRSVGIAAGVAFGIGFLAMRLRR